MRVGAFSVPLFSVALGAHGVHAEERSPDAPREAGGEQELRASESSTGVQPVGDRWAWPRSTYRHFFGALGAGRHLPATAGAAATTYLDLWVGLTWGAADGLQHGASVDAAVTLDGPLQEVVAPSYVLMLRLKPEFMTYARVGVPLPLDVDPEPGLEVALGAAGLGTAALGAGLELVFELHHPALVAQASGAETALAVEVAFWFDREELP